MSLIDAINVGKTGLLTHGARMEIHAKNISNIDTPNYLRKIPILMAKEDISFQGLLNKSKDNVFNAGTVPQNQGGVGLAGVIEDESPGDLAYMPGHPDADANGYVRKSNVNPLIDMADANMTSKAYEASLAVVSMAKAMTQKAIEIGR